MTISAAIAGKSAADDKALPISAATDGITNSPDFTDNQRDYEQEKDNEEAMVVIKSQESQQTQEVVTIIVDEKINLESAATAAATQRVSQTISTERDIGLEPVTQNAIFAMLNKINSRMERIEHQQSTMSQSSGTVIPSSKSTIKVNPEVANLYIYSITPLLWRGRMIVNKYTEINKLSMFKSIIKSFSKKVRVP